MKLNITKGTKITLLLISMMTVMSNVAIVTSLPHLSKVFINTPNIEFLSKLMVTITSFAIASLSLFLGGLINHYGKKASAIFALLLFSVAGSSGLYLQNMYQLLFSRFIFGISIAILMITATSLIGDYFEGEERHKYMGLQSAFIALGGVLFIVGGGILSDINWRYPFGIYLIGLLIIVFVYKYLVDIDTKVYVADEVSLEGNLLPVYILAFIYMTIFYILPTQFPFLVINVFHGSGKMTGAIISTAFIFNALGALSFIKLKRRMDFKSIYKLGMSILAIGLVSIGYIKNIHLFFLSLPVIGFGGGILMTNTTAWMLSVSRKSKRVKSSSYLTTALFLGQFSSPIIFQPFVNYFGVQNFFIFVGVSIFIAIFIFKFFIRRSIS